MAEAMEKVVHRKKVGLVTFHRAHNCGAALQCAALVIALERLGKDVRVIDNEDIGEARLIPRFATPRAFLGWLFRVVMSNFIAERLWLRYWLFQRRFMPMTRFVGLRNPFPSGFDCYVLGSDQVLHPKLKSEVLALYLFEGKCNNAKKVSYASSFGVRSLPVECRARYAKALSGFNALSVREDSGVEICKQELGLSQDIPVVLDPTLLLPASEYLRLERSVRVAPGYVFVYYIGRAKSTVLEIANRIARENHLKVVVATISRMDMEDGWMLVDPGEFLYLVRNAAYVVTTSFHGTAFSLINKKPFLTVIPSGMKESDRMLNLLDRLGLSDYIVREEDGPQTSLPKEMPDYCRVCKTLDELRNKSFDFLERNI